MTSRLKQHSAAPWTILHWRPDIFVHAFLLLLGALFFLWPVSAGIPGVQLRIFWIILAAVLCLGSGFALMKALHKAAPITFTMPAAVCVGLLAFCTLLFLYGEPIPPLAFSDEATIAIPSLTLLGHIAHYTTWIGLFVIVCVAWSLLPIFLDVLTKRWAIVTFLGMVCIGIIAAFLLPESRSFVRYPPLVHLMQAYAMATVFGALDYLRTPNILWTFMLGMAIWEWRVWPPAARIGAFLAIILGPLGWTYRVALFQACGELTLGIIAAFLLAAIFLDPKKQQALGGFLGALFALWFLYRPTSLAAIVASIVVLVIFSRGRAALTTSLVAFPVIAAWLLLSPIYTASYGFFGNEPSQLSDIFTHGLLTPILTMIRALPTNLHPLGLTILLGSSLLTLLHGRREDRILLGCAWLMALSTAAAQQFTAGAVFWGIGRYNILLLLPLSVGVGGLFSLERGATLPSSPHAVRSMPAREEVVAERALRAHHDIIGPILGLASIAALLIITPFDFIEYTQHLRATSPDIYREPTEGYLALPIIDAAREHLKEPNLVILAPQYTFLDLFVATGELTIPERDAIIKRSQGWTPSSPDRPILIQAPTITSYRPNLSKEQVNALDGARIWALVQNDHTIKRLGVEETVIVR